MKKILFFLFFFVCAFFDATAQIQLQGTNANDYPIITPNDTLFFITPSFKPSGQNKRAWRKFSVAQLRDYAFNGVATQSALNDTATALRSAAWLSKGNVISVSTNGYIGAISGVDMDAPNPKYPSYYGVPINYHVGINAENLYGSGNYSLLSLNRDDARLELKYNNNSAYFSLSRSPTILSVSNSYANFEFKTQNFGSGKTFFGSFRSQSDGIDGKIAFVGNSLATVRDESLYSGNIGVIVNSNSTNEIGIISNNTVRYISTMRENSTPTNATSGTIGEMRADANFLYICLGGTTWKKVALSNL